MEIEKVIEILKIYNDWRRGKIEDLPYTVKEIGIAIDIAVKVLENI